MRPRWPVILGLLLTLGTILPGVEYEFTSLNIAKPGDLVLRGFIGDNTSPNNRYSLFRFLLRTKVSLMDRIETPKAVFTISAERARYQVVCKACIVEHDVVVTIATEGSVVLRTSQKLLLDPRYPMMATVDIGNTILTLILEPIEPDQIDAQGKFIKPLSR